MKKLLKLSKKIVKYFQILQFCDKHCSEENYLIFFHILLQSVTIRYVVDLQAAEKHLLDQVDVNSPKAIMMYDGKVLK